MSKAIPQSCSTPAGTTQTITHKGATYTVTTYYTGSVTFLDLLKQLVKRDIERLRDEHEAGV